MYVSWRTRVAVKVSIWSDKIGFNHKHSDGVQPETHVYGDTEEENTKLIDSANERANDRVSSNQCVEWSMCRRRKTSSDHVHDSNARCRTISP